eukprot:3569919-Pyramimonas_sp.AAC.1
MTPRDGIRALVPAWDSSVSRARWPSITKVPRFPARVQSLRVESVSGEKGSRAPARSSQVQPRRGALGSRRGAGFASA